MKPGLIFTAAAVAALIEAILGWSGVAAAQASAQNKHLCCDLTAGMTSGACVAQAGPCTPKGDFSVDLSNPSATDAPGWNPRPGVRDASFPDGTSGHLFWVTTPPWVGFCLRYPANVSGDIVGCLRASLPPGIGATSSRVTVPVDPRWGQYQFCYGAPQASVQGSTAASTCAGVDDWLDPTVTVAVAGSCCAPPEPLADKRGEQWTFGIDQEIPGVPPPVLIDRPGVGLVAYFDPDPKLGDKYVSIVGRQCLPEYDEPMMCGAATLDGTGPSPTSQIDVNLTTPDGGLSGVARQRDEAGGGCALAGENAGRMTGVAALLALAFAMASRSRRR
jgi:hypothetical protein